MSEVKRYYVGDAGLVEGESLGRINVVLGSDYDQLVCKVGNMVCAKRQMDEELEIARDDLVIFKGALSALGEASKKLVVCARTTGGTAGPDQGLMDACDGVEGVITLAGVARAMNEFERVTAERDALQLRLTIADQRVDDLQADLAAARELLKHGSSPTPAHCESVLDFLAHQSAPAANLSDVAHDRAYRNGLMAGFGMGINGNEAAYKRALDGYQREIVEAIQSAPAAKDACSTCGGTKLVDDGELTCSSGGIPYENGPVACVKDCPDCTPATETCQFPQSCTTRCDCIPDFSPGNGNKARRRAQAIEALKPENQRVVPVQPDDPLSTCLGCFGTGTICKIEEASPTTCNECNGTGRENL